MRKIKWKQNSKYSRTVSARVGTVYMSCHSLITKVKTQWWYATVHIPHIRMIPVGPTRQSLSRAKEDAIRMASQTLLDYKTGLDKELKNFDLTD